MSQISSEDAFLMLAKWSEARVPIQVVMTQERNKRAAGVALVNRVLPHSEKVLVTLPDESSAEVQATLSLAGAEWEHRAKEPLPASEAKPVYLMTATFSNGNRYVFGEGVQSLFSKPQRLKPE